MKYNHVVKYGGEYYAAGEEVPVGKPLNFLPKEEPPFSDKEIQMENEKHKYTYEELEEMSVKRIRQLAEDQGFEITKAIKDDVINEFLSKQ